MNRFLMGAALVAAMLAPRPAAALETDELLSLVAMPLAVAAVSEFTEIPVNDLVDVVTLLNDAQVPPPQFVEVVRYVPVALVVEETRPQFIEYVRVREREGLRGLALVTAIEERLRTYDDFAGVELDVVSVRPIELVSRPDFIPVPVRTRVERVRFAGTSTHPHGGPPGQLKKERGLQTGAEVVHGDRDDVARRVIDSDDDRDRKGKPAKVEKAGKDRKPAKREAQRMVRVDDDDRDRDRKGNGHGGKGKGKGNGKGNGKGKG
jgi:hypothetical protein